MSERFVTDGHLRLTGRNDRMLIGYERSNPASTMGKSLPPNSG